MTHTHTARSGFSLAIVAMLLIAAAGLTAFMIRGQSATSTTIAQGDMREKLERVKTAIAEYYDVKGVLPCPAPLNQAADPSVAYGVSANCAGGVPAGITDLGGNVWRGMVPVQTLGVSRDLAEDNWGNKIDYATHKSLMGGTGAIEIQDASGATIANSDYVLLVTGTDGVGAWGTYSTTQHTGCTHGTSEKRFENCDNDTVFLEQPLLQSTNTQVADYYDDTIAYDGVTPTVMSGPVHDWGLDNHGRLGNGGGHNETGDPNNTAVQTLLTNRVLQVSASNIFTCAINYLNDAYCWGGDASGRLGNGGGSSDSGLPTKLNSALKFDMIAAGVDGACAIATNGTMWCWGENNHGDHGDGTGMDKQSPANTIAGTWKYVTQGEWGGCAIATDDTLHCWGDNSQSQLGRGTAGGNRYTPAQVSGGGAWREVAYGYKHVCGIKTDDTGYCWGEGANGKLGDGSTTNNTTPTPIAGGHSWATIDAHREMTCGITTSGDAYCWGREVDGSLGNGATAGNQATPQLVVGGYSWIDIGVGRNHACGVTDSYELYCWGDGDNKVRGQYLDQTDSNIPERVGTDLFFAVEVADQSTFALRVLP